MLEDKDWSKRRPTSIAGKSLDLSLAFSYPILIHVEDTHPKSVRHTGQVPVHKRFVGYRSENSAKIGHSLGDSNPVRTAKVLANIVFPNPTPPKTVGNVRAPL